MANLGQFNIDWNAVEEVSFEPLPKGKYAALKANVLGAWNSINTVNNIKYNGLLFIYFP